MLKQRVFRCLGMGVLLTILFGCAGIAKLKPEERGAQASIIQDLLAKWQSYTIYAAVWPGDKPVALLFELKSDDRVIVADGWTKVDSYADVANWIRGLQAGQSPRLFQVLGPDGQLFGYLYAAVPGVQTQVIDARTLRVYPVKPPPSPGP